MKKTKKANIFFIGAGFSKYFFNLPLTNELWGTIITDVKKSIKCIMEYNHKNENLVFDSISELDIEKDFNKNISLVQDCLFFISLIMLIKDNVYSWFSKSTLKNENDSFYEKIFETTTIKKLKDIILIINKHLNDNTFDIFFYSQIALQKTFEIISKINEYNNIINAIIEELEDRIINFSQFCSLISFEELVLNNLKSLNIFWEKTESLLLVKIMLHFLLKKIYSKCDFINKKKKMQFEKFIKIIKPSLLIDFNWDNSIKKHSFEKTCSYEVFNKRKTNIKNTILHCKIHNSINDFNIVSPTMFRQRMEMEMEILDKYINLYIDSITEINNDELEINLYFLGVSMSYYDEIFIYKLSSIFKDKKINYCFFDWNENINTQDNNTTKRSIDLLSPEVIKWNDFDIVIRKIKENGD